MCFGFKCFSFCQIISYIEALRFPRPTHHKLTACKSHLSSRDMEVQICFGTALPPIGLMLYQALYKAIAMRQRQNPGAL